MVEGDERGLENLGPSFGQSEDLVRVNEKWFSTFLLTEKYHLHINDLPG